MFVCPAGKQLRTTGLVRADGTVAYWASIKDCRAWIASTRRQPARAGEQLTAASSDNRLRAVPAPDLPGRHRGRLQGRPPDPGPGGFGRSVGTAAQKPWISAAFRALWEYRRGYLMGSLLTLRWREMDSNFWVQPFFFCASNHSIELGWGTV